MTERILIKDLKEYKGKEVAIGAVVDVRRDQGKMAFFDFRDRSGKVQGVVFGKPEVLEVAKSLSPESSVRVTGKVNERPEKMVNKNIENGDIELEITGIEILNKSEALPFDLDEELNIETKLDYRPLILRREKEKAVFRVQHEIISAYRQFLTENNFTEFQAPKLIGEDAEGTGEVFKLDYFKGKQAYLATSPQLYKQIMVGIFERVFTTGNVFRAEKHSTTRHLNEYTSIDAEMGFIKSHLDVMRMETKLMRFIVEHLGKCCQREFEILGVSLPQIGADADLFPHMKLREAQELIKKETGKDKTSEPDLEPEDERWLCEYAKTNLGSDFVFITHYPVSKRPFYTYEDEEDPGFTKSFDLLFRGVEITTGGQRVHSYESLVEKAKAKGLNPANFSFYLQAFKYGIPPHGGWGMGLERLTQKFLGLESVKEAALFPRDINRIDVLLSKNAEERESDAE